MAKGGVQYNAEVIRLKRVIEYAREEEDAARHWTPDDRAKIIEAVRVRKNAQAALNEIMSGRTQFNTIRVAR